MFIVSCPTCGHSQRCQPKAGLVTDKRKRCVYCGHAFKIHATAPTSRIVRQE